MDAEILERFWSKVNKDTESGCWEWTASCRRGYGQFKFNDRNQGAHRVSWQIHNGEIPHHDSYHGMCVLHHCDNRKCVYPKHLFLGTDQDNSFDMVKKNRQAKGESQWKAKLTTEQVRIIRYWWSLGNMSKKRIAKFFGVTANHVSKIIQYKIRVLR